jgi:hypothetical protein
MKRIQMTLHIMPLSINTLGMMALSIGKLRVRTHSIMTLWKMILHPV